MRHVARRAEPCCIRFEAPARGQVGPQGGGARARRQRDFDRAQASGQAEYFLRARDVHHQHVVRRATVARGRRHADDGGLDRPGIAAQAQVGIARETEARGRVRIDQRGAGRVEEADEIEGRAEADAGAARRRQWIDTDDLQTLRRHVRQGDFAADGRHQQQVWPAQRERGINLLVQRAFRRLNAMRRRPHQRTLRVLQRLTRARLGQLHGADHRNPQCDAQQRKRELPGMMREMARSRAQQQGVHASTRWP